MKKEIDNAEKREQVGWGRVVSYGWAKCHLIMYSIKKGYMSFYIKKNVRIRVFVVTLLLVGIYLPQGIFM